MNRNRELDGEEPVLIETLWNVKKGLAHSSSDATIVLIETLWNVKKK